MGAPDSPQAEQDAQRGFEGCMRAKGWQKEKGSKSAYKNASAKDSRECQGWRTDSGDLEREVGGELFRKILLTNHYDDADDQLIERCFLFKEVYLDLLNQEVCTFGRGANEPV